MILMRISSWARANETLFILNSTEHEIQLLTKRKLVKKRVVLLLTIYLITLLQAEQPQIRQLLLELPDQGLFCLLIEIRYIWSYTTGPDK